MRYGLCEATAPSRLTERRRGTRLALHRVALSLLSLSVLGTTVCMAQATDGQGYLINWPGNTVTLVNGSHLATQPPVSMPNVNVSTKDAETGMCTQIQNAVLAKVGASKVTWRSCSLPAVMELRSKMTGSGRLGLKIVAIGVIITLDYAIPNIGTATYRITGDLECDGAITFAGLLDAGGSSMPATSQSATVVLSNMKAVAINSAQASFINLLMGTIQRDVIDPIQKQTYDGSPFFVALIAGQSAGLRAAVTQVQQVIRVSGLAPDIAADPKADAAFLLAVNLAPSGTLVYNIVRNRVVPLAPKDCSGVFTNNSGVEVQCYSLTPDGAVTYDATSRMRLERLDAGAWQVIDDGVSNTWDVQPPRISLPVFEDGAQRTSLAVPASETYHVVAYNDRGEAPGASFSVTLQSTGTSTTVSSKAPICGAGSAPFARCMAIKSPPGIH